MKAFHAADGVVYESYDAYCEHKRSRNRAKLEELGLDKPLPRKTQVKKRTKTVEVKSRPTRRSSRVRQEPVQYEALPADYRESTGRRVDSGENSMPKRVPQSTAALSATERQSIRTADKWIDEFELYLANEEQLSTANARTVLRQVRKLASGEGVGYGRWEDGVMFRPNQPIQLSDDFSLMHDEAWNFEAEHGRDLGNGWLLRHPITKLGNYQNYLYEKQALDKESDD